MHVRAATPAQSLEWFSQLSLSGVFQNFANVQHQIVFYGIVFVFIYGINLYSMLSVIPILWLKSD